MPNPNELYVVFCDESRQTIDRYMVLGGLVINQSDREGANSTIRQFRNETNMHAELKWSKVSNQKINEYKRFIDYFFALNNTDILHFHCLILDTQHINHKKYNGGDYELGFYKFYYQLLLHKFGRAYCRASDQTRLLVKLDYRNTRYCLTDLKEVLNNGIQKRYNITYDPFVNIEPVDSKTSELMQINDIILGSIGFQKNGYHLLAGSKESKIQLADYVAKSAGLSDLINDTPYRNRRFTIWNFRLRQ